MAIESRRDGRRHRALAAGALALVAAILIAVAGGAGPARSITWNGPSEVTPGQSLTVQFVNERNQEFFQWRVTLPDNWSFVGAPTWVPPTGGTPRTCTVSGTETLCPPDADNGDQTWQPGSVLTATIQVDPAAPPDIYEVTSDLGNTASPSYEFNTFELLIRPGEPTITAPADGASTTERTPQLTGTADPGATVTIDLDGTTVAVLADADGAWSHVPAAPLGFGEHAVSVVQTVNDIESAAVASTFTVVPGAPTIDAPADGSTTTDETPVISGTAAPGATVRLTIDGAEVAVTADGSGGWSHQPSSPLAPGGHTVSAVQEIGGAVSEPVTVSFTVAEPEPPPTTPPPEPTPEPTPTPTPTPTPAPTPEPSPEPPVEPTPGPSPEPSPAPAPEPPPEPTPEPTPEPEPTPTVEPEEPAPTLPPEPATRPYVPISLSLPGAQMTPGYVSRMTGVIGPNPADEALELTVTARMSKGALYRTVELESGRCDVLTTTFTCTVSLPPGASSTLTVMVLPDAISAPDLLIQQLTVTAGPMENAVTSVTPVDHGPSDTELFALQVSQFPGLTVVTLMLFLFALAATVAGGRRY